jgi:hypothetical protein
MLLPSCFKGTAAVSTLAGAVLLGLTGALAASNPGPVWAANGWNLARPAFTLGKETTQKTKTWLKKNTRPLGTLKAQPGPPETRKVQPGPPRMQKVNPGLPAVQKPTRR